MKTKFSNKGSILVMSIAATALFLIVMLGSISYALMQNRLNKQNNAKMAALHIAEAGANYYRWVLYHDSKEFCNKETCIGSPNYGPYGPYEYKDSMGKEIVGKYMLYITPPSLNGSSVVTVRSVGWSDDFPNIKRSVEVKCGIRSWSSFSVLSGSDIRFGEDTETWGPIHSNGGIRFDGLAHNIITSSLLKYSDPDHGGQQEFGVHTHKSMTDPLPDGNNPPLNIPNRSDIFTAGRSFPAPAVSFDLLDNYVLESMTKAEQDGIVLPPSGAAGYSIVLNENDTISISRVTAITGNCSGNPTEGITTQTFLYSTSTPSNGIIFAKDRVWVEGRIESNRLTILAFKEPLTNNNADIVINKDITYTYYDGTDAIGLIAQRNVNVGLYSDDDLQIDAAMIAKQGRIGRHYFPDSNSSGCSKTYARRSKITINGSMATKNRYGFAYTDDTGYAIRNIKYDNNLTYSPPPHFPTTGEYTFLSWEEK
jgi:hypothetical protein